MVKDRESFYTKAKNFFILNWWMLWIVLVISIIINVKLSSDARHDAKVTRDYVEKAVKGVVMLTASGMPIYGEKTIIDIQNEDFKKMVRATLQKYLITDASRLTNAWRNIPSGIEDLFNKNEELKDFSNYYLDAKNNPQSFLFMKEHLRILYGLIRDDNLPENITLLKSRTDKYEIKENTFNITIFADVQIEFYLTETKTWERKVGTIQIEASGSFDASNGNAFNPLGLKITRFSTKYPKKRGRNE